jgi:hypothetical protein
VVIDFHLLIAGGAVELFFVIAFDALLADIMVRGIVLRLAVFASRCRSLSLIFDT